VRTLYLAAFRDWLACATAGAGDRAPRALRAAGDGLSDHVAVAGAAGHVLDYDDTLPDAITHVSAVCGPAALVLAAALDRTLGDALAAYAEGFEAMGALATAAHPALYDGGWHPTAVCGPLGAAVVAARLLELDEEQRRSATAIALLRAGGSRGAFGSDGKAIQVGLAAAAGVQAALAARAGARVDPRAVDGPLGWATVMGVPWPFDGVGDAAVPPAGPAAIERNWIKLHPSCLGTHAPIDAALAAGAPAAAALRAEGAPVRAVEIAVHPTARQAAHLDQVDDPLAGKFSIPYCVAFTLLHGAPGVGDFVALDGAAASAATQVEVVLDDSLPRWGAVLRVGGEELARIPCPRGTPERPATPEELLGKVSALGGVLCDDHDAPAIDILHAAGLGDNSRIPRVIARSPGSSR
jgi:2-methylcitrate dehydratase PrpD